MLRRRNDPFRDMFEQMHRLFDEFDTETGDVPIDIQETDDEVIVQADMPGVDKNQITVKARDDMLYIAAQANREVTEEGKDYVRQERRTKSYSRRLQLPAAVDSSSAEAEYTNGVLTVTLKKREAGTGFDVDVK